MLCNRAGILTLIVVAFVGSDALAADAGPLLKLLKSGRVPPERQSTVVEMICERGNAEDLAFVLSQAVDPNAFAPDLRLKTLEWLAKAAKINKVKPAGDLAAVKGLMSDPQAAKNPAFALAALRLAALWQVPEMGTELRKLIETAQDEELRTAALEGLRTLGDADSRKAIQELATGGDKIAMRFLATAALVQLDLDSAAKAAADALSKATPQDDSEKLVQAFLDRKGGADRLAAELAKAKLPPDVAKRALRTMYSVGRSDQALSDVLSHAAGIVADMPPPTGDDLARICQEVLQKGDAARGELVFRRADVNCLKCHSVSGGGGTIGPDLSPVGGSSPIDYVVNSILNPNLAIKESYATRNIITSDGLQYCGIVVDQNDQQITLKDASGQINTLATADIEQEAEGKSLMPQGLTKFLTHEEFLDLAKFISELGKPGPYAVRTRPTIQRWRVLRKVNGELKSGVPNIEFLREYVMQASAADWLSAYGKVGGDLPLEELRAATGQSVLYLQGDVEVIGAGLIGLQVKCDAPHQVWMGTTPIQPGEKAVAEFNRGRATITLRIELSDHPAPELTAEFFKPEGSKAEFVAK